MVKLRISSTTPKMAKAKTQKKGSSVNICAKPKVKTSKQAKSTPLGAVHKTSIKKTKVLAKNTGVKPFHQTLKKTRKGKDRKATITGKAAPIALKKETTVSKKVKKHRIPMHEINQFGLFVRGLNVNSSGASISQHFSQFGTVLKRDIRHDSKEKVINMGSGLVYLDSLEAVDKALAAEHTLDNSTLIVTKKTNQVATVKRKREDSDQSGGNKKKRRVTISETELFVAPIKYNTTEDTVRKHFSQFGEVVSVALPFLPNSPENKGFAFVTFKEASSLKKALAVVDQEIDSSRIVLRPKQKSYKYPHELFVGGLHSSTKRHTLKKYFSKYGTVENILLPTHKDGLNKGYGFVAFKSAAHLESALKEDHEVNGKKIDVKAARSKSEDKGAASKKVNDALAAAVEECEEDNMDCEDEEDDVSDDEENEQSDE